MRWMNCMNYLTNLNLHLKFIHCTLGGLGWKQYQTSLAVCILNNKTTQVYVAKRVQWGTDIKHLTRRSRPKPTHCVSSLARRRMSCHDRAIYAAPIQQTVSIDLNRSYWRTATAATWGVRRDDASVCNMVIISAGVAVIINRLHINCIIHCGRHRRCWVIK